MNSKAMLYLKLKNSSSVLPNDVQSPNLQELVRGSARRSDSSLEAPPPLQQETSVQRSSILGAPAWLRR